MEQDHTDFIAELVQLLREVIPYIDYAPLKARIEEFLDKSIA